MNYKSIESFFRVSSKTIDGGPVLVDGVQHFPRSPFHLSLQKERIYTVIAIMVLTSWLKFWRN